MPSFKFQVLQVSSPSLWQRSINFCYFHSSTMVVVLSLVVLDTCANCIFAIPDLGTDAVVVRYTIARQ